MGKILGRQRSATGYSPEAAFGKLNSQRVTRQFGSEQSVSRVQPRKRANFQSSNETECL